MTGQGYELTSFGPVPIGTPYLNPDTVSFEEASRHVVHPDYGNDAPAKTFTSQAAALPIVVRPKVTARVATSPRSVIAGARARVKEIRAELKRMRALEKELGELERLLKAAKQKPSSTYIRPLRNAG